MSTKQKSRNRVAPKMGALDIEYRVLHNAFFKYQNRAAVKSKVTKMGDLYYEGKEFEIKKSAAHTVGGTLSGRLREALGMSLDTNKCPPPWLINMQRYGIPPSYPNLQIPGLNAPIPDGCSYGYHVNGWGKPPVDVFGRPLYGGNPFEKEEDDKMDDDRWEVDGLTGAVVTNDGKTIGKKAWGRLPTGIDLDMKSEESEQEEEEEQVEGEDNSVNMEEELLSQVHPQEEGNVDTSTTTVAASKETDATGIVSVIPTSIMDLRKQPGDQTPASPHVSSSSILPPVPVQKHLYKVLKETPMDTNAQMGAMFKSDVGYVLPTNGLGSVDGGASATSVSPPETEKQLPEVIDIGSEGAESVLSKAPRVDNNITFNNKRKYGEDEDEDMGDLGNKFKF